VELPPVGKWLRIYRRYALWGGERQSDGDLSRLKEARLLKGWEEVNGKKKTN